MTRGDRYEKWKKNVGNDKKILTNQAHHSILNEWLAEMCRNIGDWSNGMIGVSKTFGGSSILSSPA